MIKGFNTIDISEGFELFELFELRLENNLSNLLYSLNPNSFVIYIEFKIKNSEIHII